MANSLLRWFSRTRPPRRCAAFGFLRTNGRGIVTGSFQEEVTLSPSTMPTTSSPWLMIPSQIGNRNNNTTTASENMFYKFYNLAENRVINIKKTEFRTTSSGPDPDALVVGSSHGWLAFINRRDCAVILSNPILGRNIKLPSIQTLPFPKASDNEPRFFDVERVILSSPFPDAEDCRVLIIYSRAGAKLAFCSPGCGDQAWTCLDSPLDSYTHIAYSSKDHKFICINQNFKVEIWDLRERSGPKRFPIEYIGIDGEQHPNADHNTEDYLDSETDVRIMEDYVFRVKPAHMPYVVEEDPSSSGKLYWIDRYKAISVNEDGSINDVLEDLESRFPYKTRLFDVYELDLAENVMTYVEDSLEDRVFFVGLNQSFTLTAKEFPELEANSTYFTDDYTPYYIHESSPYGGHDIGIYNYKHQTLGRCYYPCDFQNIFKIEPYPVWYTPNPV